MVGLTGFEPVTSSMSTRHSNQLSYNPEQATLLVYYKVEGLSIFFLRKIFVKINYHFRKEG